MDTNPYKLLLISTDEKDFLLLKRQFENDGHNEYEIEWKQSHTTVLEAVESKIYDVCLFDSRFEEPSNSFELLRQIVSFSNHLPIIFLIDEENDQLRIEALRAGVMCCLNKNNLNAKVLKKAVSYAVESEQILLEISGCRVRYKDLIETLPVMFFVCDPTPPYLPVYVSQAFEKFGFPLETWTSHADFWTSRIHPDDYQKTLRKIGQAVEEKTEVDLQYRLIDINGNARWFNDRGFFVRDEKGQPIC